LLQGKGNLLILHPSHREEKNIMLGLAIIVDMLQKVNKQITNITFDNFLPHTLNKIAHES
jgi:hypothetical protein